MKPLRVTLPAEMGVELFRRGTTDWSLDSENDEIVPEHTEGQQSGGVVGGIVVWM